MPPDLAQLPPGPSASSIRQLWRYTHSPLSFLEECSRRYGDPFTVHWAGYGRFVMLTAADAIKDVFRGDPHALHSGEGNAIFGATLGPNSVLVLDEEPHQRQRRIQLPPLRGERMRAFFEAMRAATLEEIGTWPLDRPRDHGRSVTSALRSCRPPATESFYWWSPRSSRSPRSAD